MKNNIKVGLFYNDKQNQRNEALKVSEKAKELEQIKKSKYLLKN